MGHTEVIQCSYGRCAPLIPIAVSVLPRPSTPPHPERQSLAAHSSGLTESPFSAILATRNYQKIISMRKEYDFSKGERGKFFHPDMELHLPVFLDPDVAAFLRDLADKKGTEIESIVNDWLRKSIDLVQSGK